jgi:ribosomal protein S27E
MSKKERTEVKCTSCGHLFKTIYWDSLNVTLDPKEKEKILAGTFFDIYCPKCKTKIVALYPMLYHDMRQKFQIWIIYDNNINQIIQTFKASLLLYRKTYS